MAGVAFTALNLAAEKIPDKAWHAIPGGYFKPPEEEEDRNKNNKSRSGDKPKNRDDTPRDKDDRPRSNKGEADRDRDRDRERPHRSEDKQRRDRGRNDKGRNDSDADESARDGSDERRRRRRERRDRDQKPQRRPAPRRSRNSGYLDRGYESDSGPKERPQKLRESDYYFPPPPVHTQAVAHYVDPENGEHVYQPTVPYHPAQFDAPPGSRDGYYVGHPKEKQPYAPADVDPETADDTNSEADYAQNRSMNEVESSRDHDQSPYSRPRRDEQNYSRSSQRYTPHDYANTPAPLGAGAYMSPVQSSYGPPPVAAYGHPAYGTSPTGAAYPQPHGYPAPIPVPVAHFAPSPAQQDIPFHNRYPSPYDSEGKALNDGPKSRSQPRSAPRESQSRGRPKSQQSRARSQSRGRKEKHSSSSDGDDHSQSRENSLERLKSEAMTYGKRHADLGTGALGALAGGFLGRNIGKKSEWGTIIGAGLGGLVGAYGEKELEKRKAKQARRKQVDSRNNSRVRRSGGGGDRSRSRSRGHERDRRDRRKSRSGYDSH